MKLKNILIVLITCAALFTLGTLTIVTFIDLKQDIQKYPMCRYTSNTECHECADKCIGLGMAFIRHDTEKGHLGQTATECFCYRHVSSSVVQIW